MLLSVTRSWQAFRVGQQVACAYLTHCNDTAGSRGGTWASTSASTSSSSSSSSISISTSTGSRTSTNHAAYSTRTERSSRDGARSTHDPQTTAALEPKGSAPQLLPPLPSHILPRFVRCQCTLRHHQLTLSHWDPNPFKSAAPGAEVPVSISLTVHPRNWDPEEYISSLVPHHHDTTGQRVAKPTTHADGSSGGQVRGSGQPVAPPIPHAGSSGQPIYSAGDSAVTFSAVARRRQTDGYVAAVASVQDMPNGYARDVFDVVLQEQVGPAAFHLHLRPHKPKAPRQPADAISPGQGPGLQVFPGTIPADDCDTVVTSTKRYIRFIPLKAIVISQLPTGTTFPADITLIIKDLGLQGDKLDHHTKAKLYVRYKETGQHALYDKKRAQFTVEVSHSHPLAAYVGRRIIRMALTPDKQLTVYLAPAAAAVDSDTVQAALATA